MQKFSSPLPPSKIVPGIPKSLAAIFLRLATRGSSPSFNMRQESGYPPQVMTWKGIGAGFLGFVLKLKQVRSFNVILPQL